MVNRIQQLQAKLFLLKTQSDDLSYTMPNSVEFNNFGSMIIDGVYYSPTEVLFANINESLKKLITSMLHRVQKLLTEDPITYLSNDQNSPQGILTFTSKKLGVPVLCVKETLETIFKDKKMTLKIHPDKNLQRETDATKAFKNYRTLKHLYDTDKNKWESLFRNNFMSNNEL